MLPAPEAPAALHPRVRVRVRVLGLLALLVGGAHLWLVDQHLPPRLGDGAAPHIRRMDVAFVRALLPSAPPATPPRPALPPARPQAKPAQAAASAPLEPVQPPLALAPPAPPAPPPEPATSVAVDVPPLPSPEALPALEAAPSSPPSAASSFEWPPSTRLSYTLSGHYRGPVQGQAQVEWLRAGSRYQVIMDVSAALVFSRRSSSEGEITAQGLSPRRYEEEDKIRFVAPRQRSIVMEGDSVRLPDGRELPRPPGLQDSVSQMVQLTWLFTTQPQLLTPGTAIELPVVLPRRVERIVYEVAETEALATPAGVVDTVHVKPRREAFKGGDLTVEFWVAPSLQYLPVRVLIRQDAETFVDLLIERLPQQAERGR